MSAQETKACRQGLLAGSHEALGTSGSISNRQPKPGKQENQQVAYSAFFVYNPPRFSSLKQTFSPM